MCIFHQGNDTLWLNSVLAKQITYRRSTQTVSWQQKLMLHKYAWELTEHMSLLIRAFVEEPLGCNRWCHEHQDYCWSICMHVTGTWSSASCDGWHLWSRGYLLWVIRPPTHIVQTHLSSSRWQQFDHQVLGNFQWKTIKILILTLIICHNLKPVVGCLLSEWFWNSGIRLVWITWAPKFHPVLSTNCKLIAIYSACGIKNDFVFF